jgi:hypothetical protein
MEKAIEKRTNKKRQTREMEETRTKSRTTDITGSQREYWKKDKKKMKKQEQR